MQGNASVPTESGKLGPWDVEISYPKPGGALLRTALAGMISRRFNIAEAGKALEVTKTGTAAKAVIDHSLA